MKFVLAGVVFLFGIGFIYMSINYGQHLPKAKLPFLVIGILLIAAGIGIPIPWARLFGKDKALPEEEIEVIAAEESASGKSTVRIPLTGVETPVKGKRCYLEATEDGIDLLDEAGELLTHIPSSEAETRIHFPSFWATKYLRIDWEKKYEPFYFEPRSDVIQQIRDLLQVALELHPEEVLASMRAKGWTSLLAGGVALIAGIAITMATLSMAKPGGTYYVMTGLLGIGLAGICRGTYWLIRAAKLSSQLQKQEK